MKVSVWALAAGLWSLWLQEGSSFAGAVGWLLLSWWRDIWFALAFGLSLEAAK